jgi:trehalose 2-sulfotransferase
LGQYLSERTAYFYDPPKQDQARCILVEGDTISRMAPPATRPQAIDITDRYVPDAIGHLVAEAVMREAAIQEFFTQGQIVPLTVTYEDFISKYEETVFDILTWLGLDTAMATVAPPAYEQLSDAVSEDWVQRFRRDKQAGWENRAW